MMNNIENIYSLSPLQQGLLFQHNFAPESAVYHQQLSLRIEGSLSPSVFAEAWKQLMHRHPVLRTAFLWEELDDAFQVVRTEVALPLTELDWREQENIAEALHKLETEQRNMPFDLAQAPLMRLCLIRLSENSWQMIWTHHHLVLDGWSVGLVLKDWLALYQNISGKGGIPLGPVRPYHDYIDWLNQQDMQAAEHFWKTQLQDFAEPTPLPRLMADRPTVAGLPYAEQTLTLSPEETEALSAFARTQKITLNTLIQGAWALLLGQYAGREDVMFGVTLGGRPEALHGSDEMVGLFINTLPLRTDWRDNPPLNSWLQRLQDLNSEIRQYEYTRLAKLKTLSQVPSERALFESILVFENFPFDESLSESAEDLKFAVDDSKPETSVRLTQGRNNYPLSLIVIPGKALELTLSYERTRLGDGEIAVMLEHLRQSLATMCNAPEITIQSLNWADPAEREKLLNWGKGETVTVPALCLHQLFERHADAYPEQLACIDSKKSMTYGALDKCANQLAHALIQQGVQPGQTVAIALERSIDFVIAMLAVLKAGACYLPLDLKQPAARISGLLEDSGTKHAVSMQAFQPKLGEHEAHVLCIDIERGTLEAQPTQRPNIIGLTAEHAAYLIYTSGSTGKPKGVVVEHRAAVDYLCGVLHVLELPPAGRFAMVSTIAADLGHTQLFGALCGGGSLCLVDEETGFNAAAFAAFMRGQAVDVLKLTPSHLSGLLAAHPNADLLPRHTLIFGGEALEAELVAQIRSLRPTLRIFNHYGPTETTVGAVVHLLPQEVKASAVVPLGRPLPNRRLYALDTLLQPVPCGVAGELYIGGEAVAREYLGAPELTSQRFVVDSFRAAQESGRKRMYRTGDRVRWLVSGELEFLGRVDHQVKIRGYRVELGEVESQIKLLSPHIQQVLARIAELPDQTPRLVAYIVAAESLNAEKLRADLSLRVPDYMVPAHFVSLDAIPLNANGKPDVKRLPTPEVSAAKQQDYAPPRNEIEEKLVGIWQSVLRVEPIGIHDNFFSLGGDSILNLQIIARCAQQGIRLTPKQLFDRRTVAEIAALVQPDAQEVKTEPGLHAVTVPLTVGQHAMIQATSSGEFGPTWRCLELAPSVNAVHLHKAVLQLQQRHDCLRLGLQALPGDEWKQSLLDSPKPVHVTTYAMQATDAAALHGLAERCFHQLAHAEGEGLHACLIRDKDQQAVLLVSHPLRIDEASWPLLQQDLELALVQAVFDRPTPPDINANQLADLATSQERYARSDALDAAWEYWLQYAGMEPGTVAILENAKLSTVAFQLTAEQTKQWLQIQRQCHVNWQSIITMAVLAEMHAANANSSLLIAMQAGRWNGNNFNNAVMSSPDASLIAGNASYFLPAFIHWRTYADPLVQLANIDAQLAEISRSGGDYGILRYIAENAYLQDSLLSLPVPQIAISVLGDWDIHLEEHGLLREVVSGSAQEAGGYALHVCAYLQNGQLQVRCDGPLATSWAPLLHGRLLVADGMSNIAHPIPPAAHVYPLCEATGYPLSELDVDWTQVEDAYPLSPMQHGMLLHTLLQPHSGVYLVQQRYRWEGPLNRQALESAWRQLLARHPILRTALWWQDDKIPLQCVYRDVDASVAWYDWRESNREAQARQLDAVLAAERRQGFDLRHAPLTCLRVFHLGAQQYEVVRSYHHILSDGWSFGLLMQDLFALYRAALQCEPAALHHAPPYRDYIAWLARQDMADAKRFWQNELADFSEPIALPIDRSASPGQAVMDSNGDIADDIEIALNIADTKRLQDLSRQYEITPNTWLQGAWAVLLSRYSGRSDVLFGVTVSGRPADLPGAENIVGLFINSLPLRMAVDDAQPVAAWLQGLFARNIDLRQYEHTPLVNIQRWSGVEPGRALFDTLMVFENAPFNVDDTARTLDFSIDMVEDRSHTNYPITVLAMPGDRLGLRISYDRNRFARDDVQRMLGHLVQLLTDMLKRPQAAIGTLDLLTASERQLLLTDWNRSEADFPLNQTYAALFAQRVAMHPERIAAVCQGESLSYAELDRRANRLAQALLAAGAQPDAIVALMAERGLPLLTMMIAVFKAGAAYQPLDINYPPQRLSELLNLSNAPIVLASEHAKSRLDQVLAGVIRQPACLITEALWLHGESVPVCAAGGPDDLAYVIFTSGSTGVPKGAMVEQRGMLNNIYGKLPAIGLCETDRLAQTASPAFDISVWQFLAAPLVGASVHILPDAITHDPSRLVQAIDDEGITLMEVVPSVMRNMLEMCPPQARLASLRWLMSIGEALPPALCRQWFERFPLVPLMNLYGPAECADNIAWHPITSIPEDDCVHMPVGRPTANNQLFILDHVLRPLPVGIPGEICTSGAGVGRGYLNDPKKTQAVFTAHPFQPGKRFYRTGDLGRYRTDGTIEFLGRRDQQVKVMGHRIELGEIESRLMRHPGVQAAAITAMQDERGTRLICYWQARDGERPAADDLRGFLAHELPPYMVPSAFVQLEKLPLNPNGKVDRKALAAQQTELVGASISDQYVEPRTSIEANVVQIWEDILKLPRVGAQDNFFALGGHSLLATQVVSRVRAAFAVDMPLRTVFEYPTLSALAQAIEQACLKQKAPDMLPPIVPQISTGRLPLSFAQQRLWFLEQLHPGSSVFNIPFALRVSGPLDIEALRESFEILISRHAVLRTAFVSEHGEPLQEIKPPPYFELPVIEMTSQDDGALQHRLNDILRRPFDLQRPPLLRAALLKSADDTTIVAVALHHIAADAWSIALLVDDLTSAYAALCKGRSPGLPTPALQYADYAAWQRQHLAGRVWQQQLDYWRQQLAGCPSALFLPGALPNAAGTRVAGRHRRQLPPALLQALQQFANRHEATLFMVLYAALNVLLHQQTGRADLVVGADVANRHHAETETMVGFFVNQLVLRCHLQADHDFAVLLEECRRITLNAYQNQDLPFDALVSELLPQRDAHVTPFFQIKLVLQNALQRELQLDGLKIEELDLEPQAAELDLLINAVSHEDGLMIVYDYDAARYPAAVIEQLDAMFAELLQIVATGSKHTIAELATRLQQHQQTLQHEALDDLRKLRASRQSTLGQARRKSAMDTTITS